MEKGHWVQGSAPSLSMGEANSLPWPCGRDQAQPGRLDPDEGALTAQCWGRHVPRRGQKCPCTRTEVTEHIAPLLWKLVLHCHLYKTLNEISICLAKVTLLSNSKFLPLSKTEAGERNCVRSWEAKKMIRLAGRQTARVT